MSELFFRGTLRGPRAFNFHRDMPRKIKNCTRTLVMRGKCPRTTPMRLGEPSYAMNDLVTVCRSSRSKNRASGKYRVVQKCLNVPKVKRNLAMDRHKGLGPWVAAVAAARRRLGIEGFVLVKKGSMLYKVAKQYYEAAKHKKAQKLRGARRLAH